MRVICVDRNAFPSNISWDGENDFLQDGVVYTVIDIWLDEGFIWYEVEGHFNAGFWENCFSRLSEIDERELIEERENQLQLK